MNTFFEKIIIENFNIDEIHLNQLVNKKSNDGLLEYIINRLGSKKEFLKLIKDKYNIDYVSESDINIEEILKVNNEIPYKYLKELEIFPINKIDNRLHILITDTHNYEKINKIKLLTGYSIKFFLAKEELINKCIYKFYQENLKGDLDNISLEDLVSNTLSYAVNCNSSDIHIEPYSKKVIIRFRIDGDLVYINDYDIKLHKKLISKIKIMSSVDISKKMIPQDGHFKLKVSNRLIDFRFSSMPTVFGEKVVLRVMYNKNKFENMKNLGFFEKDIKLINKMVQHSKGLILVTGSTGSGKSTTLSTIIKTLDFKSKNIVTVEEPVENIMEGITQISLNEKAGLNFNNTLQYILRQDPDIIMLGEIRDIETSQFAIRSSITGHLVLSTLHTNNAITSITRLINMGIEPYLITSALKGVISQKLIKKLCNKCKESRTITLEEAKILNISSGEIVYYSKGCSECNDSGTKGRVVVYEILEINKDIKEFILNEKDLKSITIKESFFYNIKKNLLKGIISIDEAIKIILEIRYDINEEIWI